MRTVVWGANLGVGSRVTSAHGYSIHVHVVPPTGWWDDVCAVVVNACTFVSACVYPSATHVFLAHCAARKDSFSWCDRVAMWLLARFRVSRVVAAHDAACVTADMFGDHVPLVRVGHPERRRERHDKFALQCLLRDCGLPYIAQTKDLRCVEDFVAVHGTVVVKPCTGVASLDVTRCTTAAETAAAVAQATRSEYAHGGVVVQTCVEGVEYVVDSVSANGTHAIVAVWEYEKASRNGAPFVYLCNRLLDERHPHFVQLCEHYMCVLNALQIESGATHGELIRAADGTLYTIEVNVRCHGASPKKFSALDVAVGYSQVSLLQDPRRVAPPCYARTRRAVLEVHLVAHAPRPMSDVECSAIEEQLATNLSTIAAFDWNDRSQLQATVDCRSIPLRLILVHADSDAVERDYRAAQRTFDEALSQLDAAARVKAGVAYMR